MKSPSFVAFAALTTIVAAVHGQALRGGEFATADYGTKSVFRVTPGGQTSLLHQGAPLSSPTGMAATADRDVIVVDFSGSLFRIGSSGITQVASGLAGPIRAAVDHNGDYIVTALSARALLRVTPAGQVSTIASGTPFQRPFGVAVDGSGDYLVADDGAVALFRVTPVGQVSVIHQGAPLRLPQGVAVLHDGDFAVCDGIVDAVFRVARGGGNVMPIVTVPTLGNPDGITSDFQGGVIVSESGAPNGNRVVHVDAAGKLTVIASGAPFQNLEDITRAPFLSGPVKPTTGPSSSYPLALDLPDDSLKLYVLAMSLSVYPGIGFAPPDTRGLTLNPDWLLVATIGSSLPGLTTRWAGVLNPNGQATAGVDFSSLAPGVLRGARLYLQGLTLDASVGVRTITNDHPLLFQ